MRRTEFFVLAAAAFSLAAIDRASSGDLPRPPVYTQQVYAPPVLPPWTRCYGGLNAGGVWSPGIDAFGFTGGGQLGCNWQWEWLAWGGEADLQYTGLNGSRDVFAPGASAHEDFRSRWLATFRGRIGWLVTPTTNFYLTGGLALATVNTDSTVNLNGTINNLSDSTTSAGWTLGG